MWVLIPVRTELLLQVESRVWQLHTEVSLRAGDDIHLVSAAGAGLTDLWTSDKRLLGACEHFGLRGRTV